MRPENVQVSVPERKKKSQNYTIFWNGTWPFATVFVVMGKQQKKGSSADTDAPQDWKELRQVSRSLPRRDNTQCRRGPPFHPGYPPTSSQGALLYFSLSKKRHKALMM